MDHDILFNGVWYQGGNGIVVADLVFVLVQHFVVWTVGLA
jgi:hypothetical protein